MTEITEITINTGKQEIGDLSIQLIPFRHHVGVYIENKNSQIRGASFANVYSQDRQIWERQPQEACLNATDLVFNLAFNIDNGKNLEEVACPEPEPCSKALPPRQSRRI